MSDFHDKLKVFAVGTCLLLSSGAIAFMGIAPLTQSEKPTLVQAGPSYSLTMNDGVSVNGEHYGVVKSARGTDFGFDFVDYTPGSGTLGNLASGGHIRNWDPFKPIQSISFVLSSGSLDVYHGWKNTEIEYASSKMATVSSGETTVDLSARNALYFKVVATEETHIDSVVIHYLCNEVVNSVSSLRFRVARPNVGGGEDVYLPNYLWVNTNIENVGTWSNYCFTRDEDGSWYYDFHDIDVRDSGYTYTIVLSDSSSAIRWDYKSNYDGWGFAIANGQSELNVADVTFTAQPIPPTHYISFDSNGGSGSMGATSTSTGSYTLPDCTFTAPSGKAFLKWEVGGNKYNVGQTIPVNEDIVLTPIWKYADIVTSPVTGLRDDFIMGMDASSVPSLEASGVTYYNDDCDEDDVFHILSNHGVNYIRVRVWNDPYDGSGNGYGGGNCDLDNAVAIGKRATRYGMKLLVDFHYSDFWADPEKQKAPKAWSTYTLEEKKTAVYDFTKSSLNTLKAQDIDVGMVQVGNETNNFHMAGETTEANTIALMKEGSKAVREVYPSAYVAVHFTNPEKGRYPGVAKTLNDYGLDYDVFGTSFYPYWHGTLSNLQSTLSTVASTYSKQVMVMETSYAYTEDDLDGQGNTSPKSGDVLPHTISIQGQYDQVRDVISTMKNTTNGLGVCYWEGTWLSINKGTWYDNEPYWREFGSGWANMYAYEYDSGAPKDNAQGCVVENQAFFDASGKILPSIDVFACGA